MSNKYLAFAILIGGKSTRFGADKGLYQLKGKRLIDYQLEVLTQFEKDIFLVANNKSQVQSYIDKIDFRTITGFIVDDYDYNLERNIRSPMLGLYSAFKELKKLNYEKLFALSCDNPLIKKEVIEFLIQEGNFYDCVIPQWKNQFTEPLFAIYPIEQAFQTTSDCIKKRKFKLTCIVSEDWNTSYIPIENSIKNLDPLLLSFRNMNTNDDITDIEKLY